MASRPYSVRAFSVATYNPITEVWGTPSAVINLQTISYGPEHDTDMMKILGANEAGLSILTHTSDQATFGGIDWPTMAIMAGMLDASSGAAVHINDLIGGGQGLPYFGGIAALPLEGGGDFHVYTPFYQLETYPPLELEQNKFALPQISMNGLRLRQADNSVYAVQRWKVYNTVTAIPADFNVAFSEMVT